MLSESNSRHWIQRRNPRLPSPRRQDSALAAARIVAGILLAVSLALAVGCSVAPAADPTPARPTAPKQAVPSIQPAPVATIPLAKPKSISPGKPVAPDSINGPRLAIDAEAVEFGDVPYQTVVAFSFNIKNVGTSPVVLGPPFIRVKEGC